MNLVSADTLQLIAWLLTLIEFILALYIFLLNTRHTANRHVSALLMLFAVNTFALGLALGTDEWASVAVPLLVATIPAIEPAVLIVAVVLLKPQWLHGRWRWVWWPVYGLVLLPIVLTLVDLALGTNLWYGGMEAAGAAGGFVSLTGYTTGILAPIVMVTNLFVLGTLPILFLLYVALFDKGATRLTRQLAWLLLGAQLATLLFQFPLRDLVGTEVASIVSAFVFVLAYAYAGFQQMISERRLQRGRLETRLTLLILAVTIPILVAIVVFRSVSTRQILEQQADDRLAYTSRALAANVSMWLDLNVQSLQNLVALPDTYSMDAERQRSVLVTMAGAHPHMYLVSTTDLDGFNIARSDGEEPKEYGDRIWFQGARQGDGLTYQTLIGRTSGEPALVASTPIRDESGDIVGVGMFASDLTDVSEQVQVSKVGESGFAYVVDSVNQVVAHPDPAYSSELRDLSAYPPVSALRAGTQGIVNFTDQNGQAWRASVVELDNGWGVFVQQPMAELLQEFRALGMATVAVAVVGTVMLLLLAWLTIRQAMRPIGTLTETATAIAGGDLDRVAPIESEDEIGTLARAFNSMTGQLRGLIGGLEHQVAERTSDLARRSAYLEATADVGRAAGSILEADQLIEEVVELIRERFGLYYVGLFEVDPGGEWAVLRAGTGAAGSAMLARGHRIRVGEGMIGWSVERGQSRVALAAEKDAVRLATAELPETRSEAALPLRSRGQVIGALTVQHRQPGAFDPDALAVLQTMADQVAVALDNAWLFTESQEALETTRRAFGEMSRQAWRQMLRPRQEWGYRYAHQTVSPVVGERPPVMLRAEHAGQTVRWDGQQAMSLAIPLRVRDEVVGVLGFRKGEGETWTEDETGLLEAFAAQLETALEGARLYQDVQRRAAEDRLVGEITARLRATMDVDTVLQTAVREMGNALGIEKVELRLEKPQSEVSPEPLQGVQARTPREEDRYAGVD